MSDIVSQDSTGTVYLAPSMAAKLSKHDHVIITKTNVDGEEVKWSDVDRTELTESTSRLPSSKIVSDISSTLDTVETYTYQHRDGIQTLNSKTETISTDLDEHIHAADSRINSLSSCLTILSTELSGFFNHTAVKFIGVSETDPATGIVTINGIRYVISDDFDESNNGNIIYYRTSVVNHKQTHIPEGERADNYQTSDQHEDVEAVRMIYAYIYANGVLDDYGHISLTGNTEDEGAVVSGGFQKIGYGFYENLSTLIHDEDVCDDAAIQKHKISGLVDDLDELYRRDNVISSAVDAISSVLSTKSLSIDDIYSRYATKTYVDSADSHIVAQADNKYATKSSLTLSVSNISTDYLAKDSQIVDQITITKNELTNYMSKYVVFNNRVLTAGNSSYATITDTSVRPINAPYALDLLGKRVLTSNVQTTLTNLTSTTKVPAMAVLNALSAQIMATLGTLSAQIMRNCEPRIGSLQYVFTTKTDTIGDINPASSNFCGWVFANGQRITCNSGEFRTAKRAFGYGETVTAFNVPLINAYMKPSNTSNSNSVPSTYPLANGVKSIPQHDHTINVSLQKSGGTSVNATVNIPRGSGTNASGSYAHQGSGTLHGYASASTTIDLSQINFSGSATITSTIAKSGSYLDAWPEPQHYSVPLLIYIGKRS